MSEMHYHYANKALYIRNVIVIILILIEHFETVSERILKQVMHLKYTKQPALRAYSLSSKLLQLRVQRHLPVYKIVFLIAMKYRMADDCGS